MSQVAFSAATLLVEREEEHSACTKLSADVVICLEHDADYLHLIQLMPLPPHRLLLH